MLRKIHFLLSLFLTLQVRAQQAVQLESADKSLN
jgi:hypothetical protein